MGYFDFDKCLIIAEAGVNHNGDLDTALKLCDAAKESGADVVKFQTWKTENIITRDVAQASYQTENTGINESQFDMLKRLELSYSDFEKIKKHCDNIGITFASTADDFESLDFLIGLGIPFIKVGSGDICNIPYLRYIGNKHMPVMLSTGMSTIEDVELSYRTLIDAGASNIMLLHCTTNYPCPYKDVNLKAMVTMKDKFNVEVGYSDHTIGATVPIAACTLGAKVIEKHFTLDCKMSGPDHSASTEPMDFREMVNAIRFSEICLGNGKKEPSVEEKEISKVVKKHIVAKVNIKKGEVLTEDKLAIKRSSNGVDVKLWDSVINSIARKNFNIDEGIEI